MRPDPDTRWLPTSRTIRLTGGVLDGERIRICVRDAAAGVIRLPGGHGRYICIDGDWVWETDHVA